MTTPKCIHCNDTGRLVGSDYFDCVHCGVAKERAELGEFAEKAGVYELAHVYDDALFAVHIRAVAMGRAAALAELHPNWLAEKERADRAEARIADLERQIAEASAPQAADADKVRDLLKALEELADVAQQCDSWESFPVTALEKAQAAIAKATIPMAPQAPVREVPEADLWELLPNDAWYLDPPDGGNVSLMEQLRRMSVDAAEWRKLARVGRAPKWISVSDKLPEFKHECTTSGCEVSDSILIYGETEFGTTGCGFGHARDDGTWQCYEAEYDQLTVSKVTHWMPLPAAPVQQTAAIPASNKEQA